MYCFHHQGDSLVQVDAEVIGRKQYVGYIEKIGGMLANQSCGKGGQGYGPSDKPIGKMGCVTRIKYYFIIYELMWQSMWLHHGLDSWKISIQFLVGGRDFSLVCSIQTKPETRPGSYIINAGVLFPRNKVAKG
jgi:hypothetical protein